MAALAYGARGGLAVAQKLKANPEHLKTMNAAGAGLGAIGEKMKFSNIMSNLKRGPSATGFDADMNRREAALILGVR